MVVVVGWCVAQLFFNAMLAALVAVLADQVPSAQRGVVSGVLGVCLPVASVCGTYLVQVFSGSMLAMFLAPCVVAGAVLVLFVAAAGRAEPAAEAREPWSLREFARTFYVSPRAHPDFAWAFVSRFLFVLAYAFLTTYQVFFLLDRVGTSKHDVPHQIFVATLVQAVLVVTASLAGGRLSDRTGRRKVFVLTAAVTFGAAMFVLAMVSSFDGFLVAMVISGIGLGAYVAVDLALVVDVLPGPSACGQGPRRGQHRRRPALLDRTRHRSGHPGRRPLRHALLRRRRLRLLGGAAVLFIRRVR